MLKKMKTLLISLFVCYSGLAGATAFDAFAGFQKGEISSKVFECKKGVVHFNEYGDMRTALWSVTVYCLNESNPYTASWIATFGSNGEAPSRFQTLKNAAIEGEIVSMPLNLFKGIALIEKNCKKINSNVGWRCGNKSKSKISLSVFLEGKAYTGYGSDEAEWLYEHY